MSRSPSLSRVHFPWVFKRIAGVTPPEYAEVRRLKRCRSNFVLFRAKAAYEAGFGSWSRVYENATRQLMPSDTGYVPVGFRA